MNKNSVITTDEWKSCEVPSHLDENGEPRMSLEAIEKLILSKVESCINETLETIQFFNKASLEKVEILDTNIHSITGSINEMKNQKKELIDTLRTMRMTTKSEVSQMMIPLMDVREFFLGKKHDEEVKQLKEFVVLCKELEALKKSGFLDSVADTILKLS